MVSARMSGPATSRAALLMLLVGFAFFAVTYFTHDGLQQCDCDQRLTYRDDHQGVQQRQEIKNPQSQVNYSDGDKQVYQFQNYTPWQNKSGLVKNRPNFVKMLTENQVHCGQKMWAGTYDNGGWEMCVAPPYKPRSTGCLVYAFGLNYRYGYESHMAVNESCLVRAYDPSMNSNGYQKIKQGGSKEITASLIYYKTGLGGTVKKNSRWHIQTLGEMIKTNGDEGKIIDMLKMDVEFAEWSALPAMFEENSLRNVKQLAFEIHIGSNMELYFKTLFQLERIGFRRYLMNRNVRCKHCFEVYYLNTHFL